MKSEAKEKRLAILALIDEEKKKCCEKCSGEYSSKNVLCQCPAAVEIRRLGAEYEAIATASRLDRKAKLLQAWKKDVTVDLYFRLIEEGVQITELQKASGLTKMAFQEWRLNNELVRGQERVEHFKAVNANEIGRAKEFRPQKGNKNQELEEYRRWRKIAESNGILPGTFQARVRKHNMPYEDAATIPTNATRRSKWADVARANGISMHTFRDRLKKGWSEERAATQKPVLGRPRKKERVEA